MSANNI